MRTTALVTVSVALFGVASCYKPGPSAVARQDSEPGAPSPPQIAGPDEQQVDEPDDQRVAEQQIATADDRPVGSDECGSGGGWSEPRSAAERCGWPVGSSGFVEDCCCCYTHTHVHDLGAVLSRGDVSITYVPGHHENCTATMTVCSSTDGESWTEILKTRVVQETWSPKTTYDKRIAVPREFRYIRIHIPGCFLDNSSARALRD